MSGWKPEARGQQVREPEAKGQASLSQNGYGTPARELSFFAGATPPPWAGRQEPCRANPREVRPAAIGAVGRAWFCHRQ